MTQVIDTKKHQIDASTVALIKKWLAQRGGIVLWDSVNLSNPGKSWTGPYKNEDGTLATKPSWECANEPSRHITDPNDVEVCAYKEVKRFRVAVRMGGNGMALKVSDGGTRKIRAAVSKAGEGAYHTFDYETQEAVIMVPDKVVPLSEWAE